MTEIRKVRAGFVGFGEINTPRDLIVNRCAAAAASLKEAGLDLFETAPVCDDPQGKEAARAKAELARQDFDVLILCVAGWIPSWAVFNVIESFKHKPMVLWGLTGWQAGDRFVTTADQAGTTALRKPMQDMGYTFEYIVTRRGQAPDVGAVVAYAEAARAVSLLKSAKIGMAGYRDMRLYGTLYDGVSLKSKIGPEIEHFELLEIARLMETISAADISNTAKALRKRWTFVKEPKPGTVENSVRLFLAFKAKIEERGYVGFSFNDVDGVKKLMQFAPAGSLTLLHDELDISSVPENDSLGAVTQLMVRYLTGQVGGYLEFYEFLVDGALMGVPDYVPAEIVEGRVTVMPNAFGDFGEGLLNVSKLKTGKVTLCRLGSNGGNYVLHIATGVARTPISWEEAGWAPPAPQLPSLEIVFDTPTDDFIRKVMSQHYIVVYGDQRRRLESLASVLGIPVI
jgi:L-fucose isomerase-like protein